MPTMSATRACWVLAALLAVVSPLVEARSGAADRAGSAAPSPSAVPNLRGLWPTFVSYPGSPVGAFPMGIYQDGGSLQIDVTGYATDDHRVIGVGTVSGANVLIVMDENFIPSGYGQFFLGTIASESVMYGLSSRGAAIGFWFAYKSIGNF